MTLATVSAGHRSKSVSTCAEVYVRALLLALANPCGLAYARARMDAPLGDDVGL